MEELVIGDWPQALNRRRLGRRLFLLRVQLGELLEEALAGGGRFALGAGCCCG
jgi:hypothetical protein